MRAPRPCLCTRQVPVLRIRLRRTWFPVRTILQSSSVVSSIKFCYHPWQFTGYPTLGFQRCAGVVGGVVPLIILAVVVALFFGRRARGRGTQEMPEYYKGQPTSPTLTATSANLPYTSHHVSSPSSFISFASFRVGWLTFNASFRQNIYGTHGQYGGMPEL